MEKWFELYRAIVMPAQCDIYGHMNVRHYAACFDDAGWHFPRMADLSLEEIRSRGLGTVVATLTIDFHHEIRAGQLVLIKGAVTRVGTKSFSHEMRLYEADAMTKAPVLQSIEGNLADELGAQRFPGEVAVLGPPTRTTGGATACKTGPASQGLKDPDQLASLRVVES